MHKIQNTLYVMTPNAYAHLENATVRIDVERKQRLRVPLHHLGGDIVRRERDRLRPVAQDQTRSDRSHLGRCPSPLGERLGPVRQKQGIGTQGGTFPQE